MRMKAAAPGASRRIGRLCWGITMPVSLPVTPAITVIAGSRSPREPRLRRTASKPGMRTAGWWLVAAMLLALCTWSQRAPVPEAGPQASTQDAPRAPPPARDRPADERGAAHGYPAWLPREALDTLGLIAHGGPFAHRQDGSTFANRERRLPPQARGYYREYTVRTPGARDRGARRIVAGGDPPLEFFYTDDHYRSFHRFGAAGETAP